MRACSNLVRYTVHFVPVVEVLVVVPGGPAAKLELMVQQTQRLSRWGGTQIDYWFVFSKDGHLPPYGSNLGIA